MFHTLTIIGVGLIGGSIGMAAKERGLARRVLGVGRTRGSLERACALNAIDDGFLDFAGAVREASIVVLATPVDRIAAQAVEAARHCPSGALLTDAGSTKAKLVAEIDKHLPGHVYFVGSHPLAGSEKRGPEFAAANLFQDRWTVITPTPRSDGGAVERIRAFWTALGARVKLMSPEEHDRALALTSHLPHLLSAALAGLLPAELFELAATGFRDTTRVAAGDPELWTAIFAHNQTAVRDALGQLTHRLGDFGQALDASDWKAMDALLTQAKKVRDALGS
ncbi:MAG: prephenate dehydrogenase/arogenate dehydrogenase family protein [Planctomycetes bacterium]|nr:prephenate dehydrogenase/arogenate dehydrogenase family protein [Planctomycetota bacterium]